MAASALTNFIRPRSRVLVASANADFRKRLLGSVALGESLQEEAVGGAHALAKLGQFDCDSVLLDKHLPDLDANEVAGLIRERYPRISVQMVDSKLASSEIQDSAILEKQEAAEQPEELESGEVEFRENEMDAANAQALPGMIGTSKGIRQVYEMVRMVAARDTTVLVAGETGTGKELVAQAIHQLSRRSKQAFAAVNCAAIPEALLEAELFGYVRGAFTGAVQSRLGRIHVAHGGTLFLDEVGDLPLSMQAKLLRFLQNGEVQRLGSSDVYRVDVRVVCATNVRLQEMVLSKQFRQDLYYRLAVFPITIPALRERTGDIGALSEHYLERLAEEAQLPPKTLTPGGLALLEKRQWNGNVRELQHALERAFILSGNDRSLRPEHFQMYGESRELREI
ncbi:MAG TPA: sigma-54 dependent transcriptional regulator [Candidatus Acidoferrum sp.]|nr:sigma-54 dependent transcriptional regulator [Candidatus Acidoferrum sp.]